MDRGRWRFSGCTLIQRFPLKCILFERLKKTLALRTLLITQRTSEVERGKNETVEFGSNHHDRFIYDARCHGTTASGTAEKPAGTLNGFRTILRRRFLEVEIE